MDKHVCNLCGQSLEVFAPAEVPGAVAVTCVNANCPMEGVTLPAAEHYAESLRVRHEIVVRWTFEQCIARPCKVTLNTALTLIFAEAYHQDNPDLLRQRAVEFRAVCQDAGLLAELAALLKSYHLV